MNLNPKREENESWEDYKYRQKLNTAWLKSYIKGTPIWRSSKQGTYINPKKE